MSADSKPLVGVSSDGKKLEKKPVKFSNLLLGAGLNMFEVTTLGQPLEVMKTTMAANRKDGMAGAVARIWSRGGFFGCERRRNTHHFRILLILPHSLPRSYSMGVDRSFLERRRSPLRCIRS